jgi:hypothetical protein
VVINLPGSPFYNPANPWVYKEWEDGLIAIDAFIFVDDGCSLVLMLSSAGKCHDSSAPAVFPGYTS